MKSMTSQMAKLRKFPFINPVPERPAPSGRGMCAECMSGNGALQGQDLLPFGYPVQSYCHVWVNTRWGFGRFHRNVRKHRLHCGFQVSYGGEALAPMVLVRK